MDSATLAFIGALLISVTGNMAQFAMRVMSRPTNGTLAIIRIKSEIVTELLALTKTEVALHEVKCRNLDLIMGRLTEIDAKLDRHLEAHGK